MKSLKYLAFASLMSVSSLSFAKDLNVVASFSVLADMVEQVGGEHVSVTTLVGPNGDPHTFEPAPKDSVTIKQADLVFMSGLGLEGWMARLVKASGNPKPAIIASEGINSRQMQEDGETVTDPHAWNSAANGAIYAQNIINALIAADPEQKAYFEKRGKSYIEKLKSLDSWAKYAFAQVPAAERKVLTSHDAFGYFGAEYGVKFLSPVGFSTESQASAADVAELIELMKKEQIHTYFIENQTDPRLVKQIAQAAQAEPGGELYPEALTDINGDAPTYAQAFQHNVETMLKAMNP